MIVLINPPYVSEWGPRVHIGLGYVAAVLREHGYEVCVVDATVKETTVPEIVDTVVTMDPDIVGVSSIAATYPVSLKICESLKERLPILTVMGGLMPTYLDLQTVAHGVDVVVRAEGEYTFLELVKAYDAGDYTGVNGITYKKDGNPVRNPDMPLINNLDELPFPAYDLFPVKELMRQSIPVNATVMSTSRGCPYNCSFCSMNTFFKRTWRGRSASNVFEEMQLLRYEYGFKELQIVDELFTYDTKRVETICDLLIKDNTGFSWICESRVDKLSESLLSKMKKAGCYAVCLGVESGVQSILDAVGKGIDLYTVEKTVEACKKVGIKAIGSFIIGLPSETEKTARKTLEFIKRLDFDRVIIHNLNPYPGSAIFEDPETYGITIVNKDFSSYHFFAPVCETKKFTITQQAALWLDILCDPFFIKRGITIP